MFFEKCIYWQAARMLAAPIVEAGEGNITSALKAQSKCSRQSLHWCWKEILHCRFKSYPASHLWWSYLNGRALDL